MAKNMKEAILITGPEAKDWTETTLDVGNYANIQKAVGGTFERVPMSPQIPGVDVWVNEDGIGLNLRPNAMWRYGGKDASTLLGPILITFGGKGRTPERVAKVKEAIRPYFSAS